MASTRNGMTSAMMSVDLRPNRLQNPAEATTESRTMKIPTRPRPKRVRIRNASGEPDSTFIWCFWPPLPSAIDAYANITKYEMTTMRISLLVDLLSSFSRESSVLKLTSSPRARASTCSSNRYFSSTASHANELLT
ncbi:hypothetical protein OGATHE_000867 [Ogataea polymorpha]|uniref:Uncharacterized protein n=1 Tax=Ogataea polymorpha TaxID=460523 RepID=A0A9P8PSA0_9ASCO|nr:hypothetical protein OGATHE_000867 [Ogataea polymorpha]